MRTLFSFVGVIFFAGGQAVAAQQTAYASTLRNGTLDERFAVIKQVLTIPATERQDVLWIAVADELERIQADSRDRTDIFKSGGQVPAYPEEHWEYHQNLIQAISEWQDPRALSPLIAASGTGAIATDRSLDSARRQ